MKVRPYLILIMFQLFALAAVAQQGPDSLKRYTKVASGYLVVLRQGDDVFAELEKLAIAEKIPAAHFNGLGFLNAKFGFFNAKTKQFKPRQFNNLEMGSFTGSIAWQDGGPSLHVHGIGADKNFRSYGGHLLGAQVSTGSLEILVTVFDQQLQRKKEEPLGANVLQLEH